MILYLDAGFADRGGIFGRYSNELRTVSTTVRAHVGPAHAIITDDPTVPFLAGRTVPPELVDSPIVRYREFDSLNAPTREAP